MTYESIVKTYSPLLDRFDIDLLIAHVAKKPREFFIAHRDHSFSLLQYLQIKRAIKKRIAHVPLAYITGTKEFYGLTFEVNKHTLIPRPDTEIMVEAIIKNCLEKIKNSESALIDIGTGTGCIPIAIMKTVHHENMKTIGVDISRRALRAAKQNAKKHHVNITFYQGNLLEPLFSNKTITQYSHIILTANLPYLTEQQYIEEPSIAHEPKTALVAGNGGLALYEELLNQVHSLFPTQHITGFFEIDPVQTARLSDMICAAFPGAAITVLQDLAGYDRCIMWKINQPS